MTQLVFVGYLLSEAPQLYWLYETENYDGALNNFIRKYRPYRPAEWVYDNTPLHYPLLRWAEFWGVDYPIEVSSLERRGLGCKNIYRPEEHDSDESE